MNTDNRNEEPITTMEWTSQQEEVPLHGHTTTTTATTTIQQTRNNRIATRRKKRKKKKTWLLVDNNNIYYRFVSVNFLEKYILLCYFSHSRPSKYLKMPYKLLHHNLCVQLNHQLIKNRERYFVFSRLRLLDELCYMNNLHKLWQTYNELGVQHQLSPVCIR